MPIYTDHLPQVTQDIHTTTLKTLLSVLPDTFLYPIDVWLTDKLVWYGQTADTTIIFLAPGNNIGMEALQVYLTSLLTPLGLIAAVQIKFARTNITALRLYDKGTLIIDRDTLMYKTVPTPAVLPPIITTEDIKLYAPLTIPWTQTLFLTGGIVKNGWSGHDVDIITFDIISPTQVPEMRELFRNALGWAIDIGYQVMTNREPVYLFKLYENGNRCLIN